MVKPLTPGCFDLRVAGSISPVAGQTTFPKNEVHCCTITKERKKDSRWKNENDYWQWQQQSNFDLNWRERLIPEITTQEKQSSFSNSNKRLSH